MASARVEEFSEHRGWTPNSTWKNGGFQEAMWRKWLLPFIKHPLYA